MRPRTVSLLCVLAMMMLGFGFAQTQEPLTNEGVLQMVKTGLNEEAIVKVIGTSDTAFDTSTEALAVLKNAGVSQKIIDAMLAAEAKRTAVVPAPPGTQNVPSIPDIPAAAPSRGEAPPTITPCLIVKHKGTVGRRLLWTALIGVPIAPGAKYDLVDAVSYKAEKVAYKGKELQDLQKQGLRVIVLEKKYTQEGLDSARKSCQQEEQKKR